MKTAKIETITPEGFFSSSIHIEEPGARGMMKAAKEIFKKGGYLLSYSDETSTETADEAEQITNIKQLRK